MMISGIAFGFMCILKETYAPALLKQKAKLRRKEQDDERYWCRYDDKKVSFLALLKVNLSRPFAMIATEPIWCVSSSHRESSPSADRSLASSGMYT